MTEAQKNRMVEIDNQIALLLAEKAALNPYAGLTAMTNQEFGQQWSETWIRSKCSNLCKDNGTGHDLRAKNGELWEVKSSKIPRKSKIVFNQCHPYNCDRFLFVVYNTVEGTETLYLVPAADIKPKFNFSCQHSYNKSKEEADCITVTCTIANTELLEKNYKVESWEALNLLAQ